MRLILTAFLITFSQSIMAHADYELVAFEASDYRSWTFDEMSTRVGESAALLPYYACNGENEKDPFNLPLRSNPRGDSLKVRGQDGSLLTYQEGLFFNENGKEVRSHSDLFIQHAMRALKRFEKIEPTRKLLRILESSHFPLTIRLGMNSFNPSVVGGKFWSGIQMSQAILFFHTLRKSDGGVPFTDIGVGGEILWHPTKELDTIEEDGVKRILDPHIALAHEMYHAFDSIRGILDMRHVRGEKYESESVLEYRAVWFENQVRKAMGFKYRKHYSVPHLPPAEAQDLLDDNGQPIYIPSVCLK
jgi:hypothetical protein